MMIVRLAQRQSKARLFTCPARPLAVARTRWFIFVEWQSTLPVQFIIAIIRRMSRRRHPIWVYLKWPWTGTNCHHARLQGCAAFSHMVHKSIFGQSQDKCLIRGPDVRPHPLRGASLPVGIIGRFRVGRGKASPGKRSQPIRPGFPGRPPSDVHRSFGARKTKPEFGHCPGHCPQFGMLAFTVDNRSRKTPAKKDPDPLSRWFSPL